MLQTVTFALAFAGFVLLALSAANGGRARALRAATAVTVAVHVFLVWSERYAWSFAEATRNGYIGFVLFHTALLAILTAPAAAPRLAKWLVLFAFATVCAGATGAVFRYDVVAVYRIPVGAVVVLGLAGAWRTLRRPQG